jgi:hypothetical protein
MNKLALQANHKVHTKTYLSGCCMYHYLDMVNQGNDTHVASGYDQVNQTKALISPTDL